MNQKQEIKKEYIRKVSIMIVIGVFTFAGIYGIEKLSEFKDKTVPQKFQSSYKQASESGQKVINLMASINTKVEKIDDLDLQGESEKSLTLIEEAKNENETAQEEAQKLSSSLDEMKNMLEGISGSEKAQVVMEAVEIESQLVEEFLAYTSELDNFLNTLSESIKNNENGGTISVQRRLESVNKKRETINSLNEKFLSKLEELNQFN